MIEIVIIIVLAALLGYKEYSSRQERENLLDMIQAKDTNELATIKYVKKLKPKKEPELPPDMVPIEEVGEDDDDFQKAIRADIGDHDGETNR